MARGRGAVERAVNLAARAGLLQTGVHPGVFGGVRRQQ
jgi:hypothetical protein